MPKFTHLHVHTHYSVLDGMSSVSGLVDKCLKTGMNALAITDHGNMFGIKEFFDYSEKKNSKIREEIKAAEKECASLKEGGADEADIAACTQKLEDLRHRIFKPIFGCEAYVAKQTQTNPEGSRLVKGHKENSSGYHLILLAKNETGYHNLCKMVSAAWIDGLYYRPRIDRQLLETYHEGIIVASACLAGEVPRALSAGQYEKAKEAVLWYKQLFGEDYYIEIQRHPTDKPNANREVYEQEQAIQDDLLRLAKETGTKIICTNDVHFVEEEHGEAQDLLICLSTNEKYDAPDRMRYTKQEWLKTPEEMAELFSDIPEALANTQEIVDKVEAFSLKHDAIMPVFDIPEDFGTVESYKENYSEEELRAEFEPDAASKGRINKLGGIDKVYRIKLEADYLRKLTMEGAYRRYGNPLSEEIMERIDFELSVMRNMGFPGYFLIVQDFIAAAREMGVSVGPGRGSAAGSVVAYCLRITDVDPLKYDLLFERFLNPDRISLPDIDVDFDDDGRYKVLDWITKKYGKEKVAHIITYGSMATKSSIKDVARVLELNLSESIRLTKLIPRELPEDPATRKPAKMNVANCVTYVPELKDACEKDPLVQKVMVYASQLEGTVRQIGIHACGIIIGADDLTRFAPLATVKDKDTGESVLVTQYEGAVVEDVGLIKMDFLGLRTLSIIKDTLSNIRKSRKEEVDIDAIPIDDEKTYQLFCEGRTIATFQFESPGMQKYLRELHPSKFEDLIAMNALYRPGPMEYIPQFINRKHGKEEITYDIPIMEQYLKETYGITVYQEQVMLLSRLLANFTRGESDTLRKAMGKKQIAKMQELKDKFLRQGKDNGHDPKVLGKIWADWEKFASYAFNKSHATCYSWVAYQTAYLKAHYPAEFMAANLTHNQHDITEVSALMAECKQMKIMVLGPDINESDLQFTVNAKGEIRFGLAAMKGVGEAASEAIVEERERNGAYTSVLDFLQRVNLRSCNRKCTESLGKAGVFDSLNDMPRELFGDAPFMEKLFHYASHYQERKNSVQTSLFDEDAIRLEDSGIEIPTVQAWTNMQRLHEEKEICGYYVSGHPLDRYRLECTNFTSNTVADLKNYAAEKKMVGGTLQVPCMIMQAEWLTSQKGTMYARLLIRDYEDELSLFVFGETFLKYKHLLQENYLVSIGLQAKLRKNQGNGTEYFSWQVVKVEALETLLGDTTKRVVLYVPVRMMTKQLAENLKQLMEMQGPDITPRPCSIDVYVWDEQSKMDVTLSVNKNLDISAFCHKVEADYPDIEMKLQS